VHALCKGVEPFKVGKTYSELHKKIFKKCNEADIEILSPAYQALRDGNVSTKVKEHLPEGYKAPPFRVSNISDS